MGLFIGDSNSGEYEGETIEPIWRIDLDNETQLVEWAKTTADVLRTINRVRNALAKENVARYRGYYTGGYEPTVGGAFRIDNKREQFPRIVVNHSQDLVEQKVANQLKYKPNFEITPDSNEISDKQESITIKKCLDSLNYWSGLPKQYHKPLRHSILTGQGWVHLYWDKNIGKVKKSKHDVKLTRRDGETYTTKVSDRYGDIAFRFVPDWEMFLFPAKCVEDTPGLMWEYAVHVEELKAKYPDKADSIKPSQDVYTWDWNTLQNEKRKDHCIVKEFFFKSSELIDQGLHFIVTDECVLCEVEDLEVPIEYIEQDSLGNLPFARITDVDIEGEINGYPSFAFIAQLQHVYDKWFTLCHRNVFLFCHPKWAYPFGAVDAASLSNNSFLLPYKSAQAPQLQVYQPLTQDLMKFGEIIVQNMEKVMRIYSVSRGTPPPGTRAAASLYFYDEQEQTANSVYKRKVEDFVVRIESLKLGLMATKYVQNKTQRLVWTLGRDNSWLAKEVDPKVFGKKYTVRIKAASNLPDSKYARIQALMELAETFPDEATKEQVLDMLDFGQSDKFIDYARVSIMAAESENESLMCNETVDEPRPYEYQMGHWKSHVKLAQDPNFKKQEKEVQKRVEEHIGAHEVIMLALGNKNPQYKQQLMQIAQFPLFAVLPPVVPGMQGDGAGPGAMPPAGAPNPVGRPARPKPSTDIAKSLAGAPEPGVTPEAAAGLPGGGE